VKSFSTLRSRAIPVNLDDVDTDQIIPGRFLTHARSAGFGQFQFYDFRFSGDEPIEKSPFHDAERKAAKILVGRANFGCGSSRESAVWALIDGHQDKPVHQFEAVIAMSFGDIFYANACKNKLLPVVLAEQDIDELLAALEREPLAEVAIDLEKQRVSCGDGHWTFSMDSFRRELFLLGLDDTELALQHADRISAFEQEHRRAFPWLHDFSENG